MILTDTPREKPKIWAAVIAVTYLCLAVFRGTPLLKVDAIVGFFLAAGLFALALRRLDSYLGRVQETVTFLTFVCFEAMLVINLLVGGTPLGGKVEHARFYVGSWGTYREVSTVTYFGALVPVCGFFLLWPVLFTLPALRALATRHSGMIPSSQQRPDA
jgi:hypothetical protein